MAIMFSAIMGLIYGVGTWLIGYFLIWPLFVTLTFILRKKITSTIKISFLSLVFGLTFGLLYSIGNLVLGGYKVALLYFIKGIPFDIVHGVSNMIIVLVLFEPLYTVFFKYLSYENKSKSYYKTDKNRKQEKLDKDKEKNKEIDTTIKEKNKENPKSQGLLIFRKNIPFMKKKRPL